MRYKCVNKADVEGREGIKSQVSQATRITFPFTAFNCYR